MQRHLSTKGRRIPGSTALVLAMILLCALTLRLYHLDWDEGTYLHPDELHVANTITTQIVLDWPPDFANLFSPDESRLNPRSTDPTTGEHHDFAYGALPLIATDLAASFASSVTGDDWNAFYGRIYKIGRALSALIDTLTVLVVYFLGKRMYSSRAGLVAAALYATAPIPIQLSHFFTTDTWMTFFTTLSLYLAVRAAQDGGIRWFAASGAAFGLAMASKPSVPMMLAVIAVTVAVDVGHRSQAGEPTTYALSAAPERLFAFGIAGLLAFALFEPYAIASPFVYLDQLQLQARIVQGQFDVPFTRQYVGTTPGLYQIEQLVRWGLGPIAGITFLAGGLYIARHAFRSRHPGATVLTVWLVTQGLVIVIPETKFLRYLEPLLPILAVGAGGIVVAVYAWVRARTGAAPANVLFAVFALCIAAWTAAFASIYTQTNPRIEASNWIYANVSNGSKLTAESWDLALPLAFAPGMTASDRQLEIVPLEIYRDRTPQTVADDLFTTLSETDYVVMSSNRARTAVERAPWRYPVQNQYYVLLMNGELGFTLVAGFKTEPGLGPVHFDDQSADESFVNYDHPEVLVFKKIATLDRATFDALMAPAVDEPYTPTRHADGDNLMLDGPVDELPTVADARWSASLTGNTLAALLLWIVLLIALQLIGAPLAATLFPRFPELGWGFARLITVIASGYLVWILASLEVIRFRATWCFVAVGLIAGISLWLAIRQNLVKKLRRNSKNVLAAELVFWAVFALFLIFRFINPDSWHPLWGGEKPMEFAHINAILRSAHFPPYDPWFSGGYINYYYYGSYLIAFLFKLTGIPSEIAFNLAQPTFIAMLASAAYSITSALSRGLIGRRAARIGGLIGALFMVIAGNLDSAVRFIRGLPEPATPDFFGWTWAASRAITGGITEFPYFTGLYADLHAHVIAWPMTLLVIALCYSLAQQPRQLAVALSRSARRRPAAEAVAGRLLFIAVVLGTLFATNAWDVPVYAALVATSIFIATGTLRALPLRITLTVLGTLVVGLVSFILFLPFHTHYVTLFGSLEETRTQTDLTQFATHLAIFMVMIAAGMVALLLRSGFAANWVAYVDPIAVATLIALLIVAATAGAVSSDIAGDTIVVVTAFVFGVAIFSVFATTAGRNRTLLPAITACVMLAAVVALLVAERTTLALALAFVAIGIALWFIGRSVAERFLGALIAAAFLIAAGVELVFLADDLVFDPVWYRMNTVFKFYNQIWSLLAISAATLFTYMVVNGFRSNRTSAELEHHSLAGNWGESAITADNDIAEVNSETPSVTGTDVSRRWAQVGAVAGAVLLAGGLLYPLLSTVPRLDLRFPDHPGIGTLNALDWMHYGTIEQPDRSGVIQFADDLAAIDWFNENIEGTPVIAEASIGPYRGNGSRISIATGLPTIIGWDRHERQQRYQEEIDPRVVDVRTLYDSSDPVVKIQILREYDVEYVIVGDVERYSYWSGVPYASSEGIAAFDELVGDGLEVAFQFGSTVVYRVLPS